MEALRSGQPRLPQSSTRSPAHYLQKFVILLHQCWPTFVQLSSSSSSSSSSFSSYQIPLALFSPGKESNVRLDRSGCSEIYIVPILDDGKGVGGGRSANNWSGCSYFWKRKWMRFCRDLKVVFGEINKKLRWFILIEMLWAFGTIQFSLPSGSQDWWLSLVTTNRPSQKFQFLPPGCMLNLQVYKA